LTISSSSSRRFTCDPRDAYANGLIDSRPHFNSVSNYLANPELTGILKNLITMSSLPLKAIETEFAVDSSGFSTCRYVRWFNKKYGREVDNREWVKVHLMCGVNTKVVTSVEVSDWAANDTTHFIPLLARTAQHFEVREVSADKAYLSRKNLNAVESVGGMPFIPFKSNTPEPTEAGMWARMYHLFMCQREAYMEHYHKRSNIESLLDDKGQVWERPTLQERYGADKRGVVQGGGAQHLRAHPSDARLQHPSDFLRRIFFAVAPTRAEGK
jgi:transposase